MTPVTATVVRTPAATSPGCLARNAARSGFRGLQACTSSQCMGVQMSLLYTGTDTS